MASIRKTIEVLNYLYMVMGILCLIGVVQQTYSASKYNLIALPVSFNWVIVVMIFVGFFMGRKALEQERENPHKLIHFSLIVCACLILQIVAQIVLFEQAPNKVGKQFQKEFFGQYDTLPTEAKQFIQTNQQNYNCCAIFGWQDYEKPANQVPDSCCGLYRGKYDQVGKCSKERLDRTPGCNDQLFEILRNSVSSGLVVFIIAVTVIFSALVYVSQLLLAIFAAIHARRLLQHSNSKSRQNLM